MNGRNYIKQQKLKKDKETFKKKLYLSNNIEFFTTQIKSFSAQIKELTTKKKYFDETSRKYRRPFKILLCSNKFKNVS